MITSASETKYFAISELGLLKVGVEGAGAGEDLLVRNELRFVCSPCTNERSNQ
jgi:hypothetical protein